MASYSSPTAAKWLSLTGLNRDIEGEESDSPLNVFFGDHLADTEAEVAFRLTVTYFESSSLTAKEVTQLQNIVLHRQAAKYFARVQGQSNTGTAEPIGIHLEGRSPQESAEYHSRRARALELALLGSHFRERALLEDFS